MDTMTMIVIKYLKLEKKLYGFSMKSIIPDQFSYAILFHMQFCHAKR